MEQNLEKAKKFCILQEWWGLELTKIKVELMFVFNTDRPKKKNKKKKNKKKQATQWKTVLQYFNSSWTGKFRLKMYPAPNNFFSAKWAGKLTGSLKQFYWKEPWFQKGTCCRWRVALPVSLSKGKGLCDFLHTHTTWVMSHSKGQKAGFSEKKPHQNSIDSVVMNKGSLLSCQWHLAHKNDSYDRGATWKREFNLI